MFAISLPNQGISWNKKEIFSTDHSHSTIKLQSIVFKLNYIFNCLPPDGDCGGLGNGNCGDFGNGNFGDGNGNWLSLHIPHVLLHTSASVLVEIFTVQVRNEEMVMQRWDSSLQGLLRKCAGSVNLKIPFQSIWKIFCHF